MSATNTAAMTTALSISMSGAANSKKKKEFLATCQEPNIDRQKEASKLDKAKPKILQLKSYKRYKIWFPIWIILVIILCAGGLVVLFYPTFYDLTHDSIDDAILTWPQFISMIVSGGVAIIVGIILSYFQPRFVFRVYRNKVITIYRSFLNTVYIDNKKILCTSEKSFSIDLGTIKAHIDIYRFGYRIRIGKEKLKNKRFGQYY